MIVTNTTKANHLTEIGFDGHELTPIDQFKDHWETCLPLIAQPVFHASIEKSNYFGEVLGIEENKVTFHVSHKENGLLYKGSYYREVVQESPVIFRGANPTLPLSYYYKQLTEVIKGDYTRLPYYGMTLSTLLQSHHQDKVMTKTNLRGDITLTIPINTLRYYGSLTLKFVFDTMSLTDVLTQFNLNPVDLFTFKKENGGISMRYRDALKSRYNAQSTNKDADL